MLIPALAAFFLSGFAALLYQVTWQRMLVIFSGADVYSATMVIAAFMAGLGCGSLAGGFVADRLSRFATLVAFAAAEAGIAFFGLQSKTLFYDVLYGQFAQVAAMPVAAGLVLFVSLLLPTCLMGASLPLLARAMTRHVRTAARTIGWLYAINTLGAAIGAMAATWWYIPHRGIEGTLVAAAWLNLACAALVVPLALIAGVRFPRTAAATEQAPAEASVTAAGGDAGLRLPFSTWVWLYGLSGFIALSFEIVWFRLLGVMLKSTAFTFGTLLAQYLFWLGLGSALGSMMAGRIRRPAAVFLMLQTAAAVYAGLSLSVIVQGVGPRGAFAKLREYFSTYDPLHIPGAVAAIRDFISHTLWNTPPGDPLSGDFITLYLALPVGLIAPATLLMGMSFPMLQRVVQTDMRRIGRRTGLLLVANIAGSTLGTMLTGWVLLGLLGTAATLIFLIALSGSFAVAAWHLLPAGPSRMVIVAAAAALVIATLAALPSSQRLWAALHGTTPDWILAAEDGSGVSVLTAQRRPDFSDRVVVYVNGLGQSHLPYGGIHTELGALPALLHPSPQNAAIIGLGSGDTLFGAAGRPELQRIVSIEIIKPQIDTLRELFARNGYAGLSVVLHDRRIHHVFGDGRLVLGVGGERFDIIEADALRPQSAYAGNLYSEEYFALLRDRLKPGGYAVTWAPTGRVTRTFVKVFPHVLGFGSILIGANEPVHVDLQTIASRLSDPRVQNYYAAGGVEIAPLVRNLLRQMRRYTNDDPAVLGDTNTDLFPRDEFEIPRVFD
jgi:spermidine synthase